ncbi:MAG: hypothetical protein AUJ98_04985 [Bacteroidetes bacterium CG2_30_33_31]|nr:MAG: hypothetical protein AUJ98_04985 [Bacteroidetes bacterium CG2_30_33_31]
MSINNNIMKTFAIVLISVFFHLNIISQNWIQPNSVWHYDYSDLSAVGFYKYEYKSDTLIYNHLCQKVVESVFSFYPQPNGTYQGGGPYNIEDYYFYNVGDTVYLYENGGFKMLYDFGASVGDSWIFSSDSTSQACDTTKIFVTAIGNIQIVGQTKRFIEIQSNVGAAYYIKGKAIEGIGLAEINYSDINSTLIPRPVFCDSSIIAEYYLFNFKCFGIDSITLYNPSGLDCEYYLNHVGINSATSDFKYKIYPNPTSDRLNIEFNIQGTQMSQVKIYDFYGCLLASQKIYASSVQIDINRFPKGIYLLQFTDAQGKVYVDKFMKI